MTPRPLLVTSDDAVLEDLLRLAAAAGVTLDVARDADAALTAWSSAPLVLVGSDALLHVASRSPVRREHVHVVSPGPVPDDLFRGALAVGAENVAELPAAEPWLVEVLADVADGLARRATTIAVVGGAGGVGASTFAAALATCAASVDHPATLVEADPLGGGLDRVVGLEATRGVRWEAMAGSAGRLGSRSLREALPHKDGLAVLAWGRSRTDLDAALLREVLSAAQRGSDTVVVDLPRHPTPGTADVLARTDHLVVVTTLTLPAVAACGRVVSALGPLARRTHLVARGRDTSVDPREVAAGLGVPLAGVMPDQRRLEESVDLGLGPVRSRRGPLARTARAVLTELGAR